MQVENTAPLKRYTVYNFYIRGSNQTPQALHALMLLTRASHRTAMTNKAQALLIDWEDNHQTEVVLQGPQNKGMIELHQLLKDAVDIPSSVFYESEEALNGACTVLTLVASAAIVAAVDSLRFRRIPPSNALVAIMNDLNIPISEVEAKLAAQLAYMPLA